MTETVHSDYEVSSEDAVRHWEIPYARLTDATPTPTNAAEVTGRVLGAELTGTILTIDPAPRSMAIIDFTASMVYRHDVRTVLTYAGAEASWGDLNIGDPVYYDSTPALAAQGVYLSTSPIKSGGGANPLFGWIVPGPSATGLDTDTATYPKLAGASGNTWRCAVMQRGAGG